MIFDLGELRLLASALVRADVPKTNLGLLRSPSGKVAGALGREFRTPIMLAHSSAAAEIHVFVLARHSVNRHLRVHTIQFSWGTFKSLMNVRFKST